MKKILFGLVIMSVLDLTACNNEASNPMLSKKFITDVAIDVSYSPDGKLCTTYFQAPKEHQRDQPVCEAWIHKAYAEFMSREQDEAMIEHQKTPVIPSIEDFEQPTVWVAVEKERLAQEKARHQGHAR